jgi:hypothetical protein
MATDIIISTDNSTNTAIDIYDSTDYAALNSNINDINAVRFLFSTYNSVLNTNEVGVLKQNYEYIVISGSFAMDGITYSEGGIFVARQNYTLPTTGVSVWNTGYYSTYNQYLPKDVSYFRFNPSDLAESGTTFSDSARTVRYEVYNTIVVAGDELYQYAYYIVRGNANDFITLSGGQKYYVGQVFSVSGSDGFASTGSAYVVQQLAVGSFDFWTNANSGAIYQSYVNSLSNSTLNASQDFKDNFIRTNTLYSLPYIQSATSISYDFSAVQASLDIIVNYLGTKNKNIK